MIRSLCTHFRFRLRPTVCLASVVLVAVATTTVGLAGAAGQPSGPPSPSSCQQVSQRWQHPVEGPIVDRFRPPSTPYGPGNRGLEYLTTPGAPVRAVANGVVTFAGPVGGSQFVVVRHPSGIRSTYAYLTSAAAAAGASIVQGELIASADAGFHLTARNGNTYIDPLSLMAEGCFIVRLVPVPG